MLDTIDANTANLGAWPDGDPIIAEVSLLHEPREADLVEVDGVETDESATLTTRCAELEGALRLLIDHADTCATGLRSGTLSASQASAFLVGERLNVGATTEARAVLAKGAK